MGERKGIRSAEYIRQYAEFDGLKWDRIGPTDIDGFMDFGNRLFVFVEAKFGAVVPDPGQRIAFERLTDACHQPPRRSAVGFLVSHQDRGPSYRMATAIVTRIRWQGDWQAPTIKGATLLDEIGAIRAHLRLEPAANDKDPWLEAYEKEEAISWAPRTAKEMWGS